MADHTDEYLRQVLRNQERLALALMSVGAGLFGKNNSHGHQVFTLLDEVVDETSRLLAKAEDRTHG